MIEADEFYELFEALDLRWRLDEEKTLGSAFDAGDFYRQDWLNAIRNRMSRIECRPEKRDVFASSPPCHLA